LVDEQIGVEIHVDLDVVAFAQWQRDRGPVGALVQRTEKIGLRGRERLLPIQCRAPAPDNGLPVLPSPVVDLFVVPKEQLLIDPQNLPPIGIVGILGREFENPHQRGLRGTERALAEKSALREVPAPILPGPDLE
jgi:hypothetical protein